MQYPRSLDSRILITLGIKIAQKPYIVWSLGPKALIYESLDPYGYKDPKTLNPKP